MVYLFSVQDLYVYIKVAKNHRDDRTVQLCLPVCVVATHFFCISRTSTKKKLFNFHETRRLRVKDNFEQLSSNA